MPVGVVAAGVTRAGGHPPGRRRVGAFLVSHTLATVAEWAALVPLLVYAYEHSGPSVVGIASFSSLMPYVLLASSTARAAQRFPVAVVRACGMVGQGVGFGLAGAAAAAHWPLWVVVAGTALGFCSATALRPAGAVLLPALVRTSQELTTANVRVGHANSASLMLGPAMAMVLLGVDGPAIALAGAAVLSLVGAAVAAPAIGDGPPATHGRHHGARPVVDGSRARRVLSGAFADIVRLARRPDARAVLIVAAAEFMLVGASDVIWVVVAGKHVDLGSAGAGVLSALFGVGSFLSSVVSGRAARRPRLAPLMVAALAAVVASCLGMGAAITLLTAVVLIPVMGLARALLDLFARVLLQRSAPPSELAGVFGALETSAGAGLLTGSLLAQVLVAWSGAAAALVGTGVLFALVTALVARSLRAADAAANVPVVEMSLLRLLPLFAHLPVFELEAIARSAHEVHTADGEVVIRAGDVGDRFYAIADGAFAIVRDGVLRDTATRGQGFGEVALLADVPRTATVTAVGPGALLAIDRDAFLLAVTGHAAAHDAAWTAIREWGLDSKG